MHDFFYDPSRILSTKRKSRMVRRAAIWVLQLDILSSNLICLYLIHCRVWNMKDLSLQFSWSTSLERLIQPYFSTFNDIYFLFLCAMHKNLHFYWLSSYRPIRLQHHKKGCHQKTSGILQVVTKSVDLISGITFALVDIFHTVLSLILFHLSFLYSYLNLPNYTFNLC